MERPLFLKGVFFMSWKIYFEVKLKGFVSL